MPQCPEFTEDVREGALECRFWPSSLLPLPPAAGDERADRRTTYVVDTDLVRLAKFAAALLAVFLVVVGTLFGFKLETSVEKVSSLQAQARETAAELQKAQQELAAAKAAVVTLKAEVQGVLAQANLTLSEIGTQRDTAIAMVSSIRVPSPRQAQALAALPSAEAERTRRGSKLWAVWGLRSGSAS